MPEGDSLHKAAKLLGPLLTGHALRVLQLPRRVESTEGLLGQTIELVEARGKNLLIHFAQGMSLHVHLKMWGRIFIKPRRQELTRLPQGTVVLLETDDQRMLVVDAPVARLIARRDLHRDLHFRHLGPDLLGPTFDMDEALHRLALRKHVPLGEALMDQSAVAGIGNVWKSELCFNLKLDPFANVSCCTEQELRALLDMARVKMRENVDRKPRRIPDPFAPRTHARATRIDPRQGEQHISVYGREGKACYDCGKPIAMQRQGDTNRSTYYCAHCQPSRRVA